MEVGEYPQESEQGADLQRTGSWIRSHPGKAPSPLGAFCACRTHREATGLFPDMGWGLPGAREDVSRSRGKRGEKETAERR